MNTLGSDLAVWQEFFTIHLEPDMPVRSTLIFVDERLTTATNAIEKFSHGSEQEQELAYRIAITAVYFAGRVLDCLGLCDGDPPPMPQSVPVALFNIHTLRQVAQAQLANSLCGTPASKPHVPDASRTASASASAPAPARSWTQPEVDDAIYKYKAQRSGVYHELVAGVEEGRKGAAKSATEIFGRNAVARTLGIKSRAMVSKSPAWCEIAEDLKLSAKHRRRRRRIGQDIAIEYASVESFAEDEASRQAHATAIRFIEQAMPKQAAQETIEKLQRGEISDEEIAQIAALCREQQIDDRAKQVHSDCDQLTVM